MHVGCGTRPDHARALAEADCLRRLLAVYLHTDSSDDLKTKAKRALKSVIQKCTHLPALEPLLQESPPNILKSGPPLGVHPLWNHEQQHLRNLPGHFIRRFCGIC